MPGVTRLSGKMRRTGRLAGGMEHEKPESSSEPSRDLAEAAAGGSVAAVETLLRRFLPRVHAYVRGEMGAALRAREESWDLAQSACREVLRDVEKRAYRSEAEFRIWLFKAALRKVQERGRYFRREKRDTALERPVAGADSASRAWDVYRTLLTPSRIAGAREGVLRFETAMAALSPDQREVVHLHLLVGLPHAEVAARTGRSEEAVRALYHRAKVKLAAAM